MHGHTRVVDGHGWQQHAFHDRLQDVSIAAVFFLHRMTNRLDSTAQVMKEYEVGQVCQPSIPLASYLLRRRFHSQYCLRIPSHCSKPPLRPPRSPTLIHCQRSCNSGDAGGTGYRTNTRGGISKSPLRQMKSSLQTRNPL